MATSDPKIILVTGGAGYVGSQLIRDLAHVPRLQGATIRILDNMQRQTFRAFMNLPSGVHYEVLEGDILDPIVLGRALRGVDTVVHLAALVRTPFSFDNPSWTEQINHWGTARLVEQCLDLNIERFIFTSSASVYGPGGVFVEGDPCYPVSPYSKSKLGGERAVLAAAERGLRPTILRLGIITGMAPAIRFDAVANRFAYLVGVGRPLTVFGSGDQIRPLVHIRDATAAVGFCLTHPATAGEVLNIVGKNVSVLELVDYIRDFQPGVRIHHLSQDALTDFSFMIDGGRAAALGWTPKYALEDALHDVASQFLNVAAPSVRLME